MIKRLLLAGLIAALGAGQGLAQTTAITNARIVSMGPAGALPGGTVLVRDGKIAAIGRNVQVPAGVPTGNAVPLVLTVTDPVTGQSFQSNTVMIAAQ